MQNAGCKIRPKEFVRWVQLTALSLILHPASASCILHRVLRHPAFYSERPKKESYRMHNAGAEYRIPPKSALSVQRGSVWCRCSLYRLQPEREPGGLLLSRLVHDA